MCANNNFRTRSLEWQSCECAASFFWWMFGIKSFVEDFNWPGQLKKSPTIWSHLPSPHIETFKRFDQQIHTFYVVWRCWEHYHSIFELHTKCWFVTQISSRNVHAISYKCSILYTVFVRWVLNQYALHLRCIFTWNVTRKIGECVCLDYSFIWTMKCWNGSNHKSLSSSS